MEFQITLGLSLHADFLFVGSPTYNSNSGSVFVYVINQTILEWYSHTENGILEPSVRLLCSDTGNEKMKLGTSLSSDTDIRMNRTYLWVGAPGMIFYFI